MAVNIFCRRRSYWDEATQRDPNFLLAYCLLVEVHTDLYWGAFDRTPARLELARTALEKAEAIQPDAGQVHMAKGIFAYHGYRDYAGARAEFALARRTLPNSAHLVMMTAAVDRREGHWEDTLKNFHRAVELDPLDFLHTPGNGVYLQPIAAPGGGPGLSRSER